VTTVATIKSWMKGNRTLSALYGTAGNVYWRAYWSLLRWRGQDLTSLQLADINRTVAFALNQLRDIEGDVAEFGVLDGKYSPLECWWLKFFGQRRNLHLFDSWEGYGEPAAQDLTSPEVVRGTWRRGPLPGQVPPEELQRRLERIYKGGRIITHKGFFAQTLATIPPETKFALIVIDPGRYSAIDEVLTHLFSHRHVPEGAIILFNTYNASRASPAIPPARRGPKQFVSMKSNFQTKGRFTGAAASSLFNRIAA
jgi:O-methyltransferase